MAPEKRDCLAPPSQFMLQFAVISLLFYANSLKLDRTHGGICKSAYQAAQDIPKRCTFLHLGKCWRAAADSFKFLAQRFETTPTVSVPRWVALLSRLFPSYLKGRTSGVHATWSGCDWLMNITTRLQEERVQSVAVWRGGRIRINSRSFSWAHHCPG